MQFSNAETLLYEISLSELPSHTSYGDHTLQRVVLLYACLQSSKAYLDAFLCISPSLYYGEPFTTWSQFSNLVIVASRLSLQHIQGWNSEYARNTLCIPQTMEQIKSKLEEANELLGLSQQPEDEENLYLQYGGGVGGVLKWYEQKIASEEQATGGTDDMMSDWGLDFTAEDLFGGFDVTGWDIACQDLEMRVQ